MRDIELEQLTNIDPNSNRMKGSHVRNDSSKNSSFVGRKNSSFRQLSNVDGSNTERHRCSSVISRSKKQRNDLENFENNSINMPHLKNIDLNQSMMPIIPLYLPKEKEQILEQVNKSKATKLKAFMKIQETTYKKITDDLYPLHKVFHNRGIRKSEDSKNCLSVLSQTSQRDLPNPWQNKAPLENTIITQKQEKFLIDHDIIKSNVKHMILQKKNSVHLAKDYNNGSQNTQRMNQKTIDTSFPNNVQTKKDKNQNSGQNKLLKDLEIFKTTLKPHVSLKPGSGILVQIGANPVKGHKRVLSMDQVINSSTKPIISSQKPSQQQSSISKKSSGIFEPNNIPHPSQANHEFEDETKFYEEFFSTNKMTFEFERFVIEQRNKKRNEKQPTKVASRIPNKPSSVHMRTRSIEESTHNNIQNKTNTRWVSKRLSCPDESSVINANFN